MVDALSRVRRWLKPGGILLDVRPTPEPVHLELQTGLTIVCAGDMQDREGGGPNRRHAQAEVAMTLALASGWFRPEAHWAFAYHHCADSVPELQDYADATWKDARFDDEAWRRAGAFVASETNVEFWLNEQATMTRLVPIAD